jgi:hypothetical protein
MDNPRQLTRLLGRNESGKFKGKKQIHHLTVDGFRGHNQKKMPSNEGIFFDYFLL